MGRLGGHSAGFGSLGQFSREWQPFEQGVGGVSGQVDVHSAIPNLKIIQIGQARFPDLLP